MESDVLQALWAAAWPVFDRGIAGIADREIANGVAARPLCVMVRTGADPIARACLRDDAGKLAEFHREPIDAALGAAVRDARIAELMRGA